jgi:hypothetical protein
LSSPSVCVEYGEGDGVGVGVALEAGSWAAQRNTQITLKAAKQRRRRFEKI